MWTVFECQNHKKLKVMLLNLCSKACKKLVEFSIVFAKLEYQSSWPSRGTARV